MRSFSVCIEVEFLKLRRTLALWLTLLAPAVVTILQFMVMLKLASRMGSEPDVWLKYCKNIATIWAVLMMPMLMTLEAGLLAQLEHQGNHWKDLLVYPLPRWTFYGAKFVALASLVVLANLALYVFTLGTGILLQLLRPALKMGATPWTHMALLETKLVAAAILMTAIQHWVSVRWRSFTVGLSFGVLAMVIGFSIVSSEYAPYYPWTMPYHTFVPAGAGHVATIIVVSVAGGVAALLAGSWDFARREMG